MKIHGVHPPSARDVVEIDSFMILNTCIRHFNEPYSGFLIEFGLKTSPITSSFYLTWESSSGLKKGSYGVKDSFCDPFSWIIKQHLKEPGI